MDNSNYEVMILYTNYRGNKEWRHILPLTLELKSTKHHPQVQWILQAYAYDRKENRSFAMKEIHQWMTVEDYKRQALEAAKDRAASHE